MLEEEKIIGCYLVKDLVASLPPSPFCAQPRSPRCVPGSVTPVGGEAWAWEWGKNTAQIPLLWLHLSTNTSCCGSEKASRERDELCLWTVTGEGGTR